VLFKLDSDALVAIDVALQQSYPSMDACGTAWEKLRKEMEGTLGASRADALLARWESASSDVTLACEPGAASGALLKAHFAPRGGAQ
jgi:hypothetical protein